MSIESPGALPRWIAPAAVMACVVVALAVHLAASSAVVRDWSYVAATAIPAVAAVTMAALHPLRATTSWRWIAGGVALSALADVLYQGTAQLVGEPGVSTADIAWVLSYGALGMGMLGMLRRDPRRRLPGPEVLLDVATVVVLAFLVVWQVSLADTVSDGQVDLWVRAVGAVYPVLDAVLFALVVRLIATRRSRTLAGAALLVGIGLWLGTDLASMIATGAFQALDTGWVLGAAFLGAAVVRVCTVPTSTVTEPPPGPVRRVGAWRLGFGTAALLVPLCMEILAVRSGQEINPVLLLVSTALLASVLYLRALRLLRQMRRAETQLRSTGSYYQAIAANSSDAVMVADRHGAVISDSSNLGELVGSRIESAVGASLLDLIWLAEPDEARDVWVASIATPGQTHELEVRLYDSDRQERWMAARVVNLLDDPAVGGVVINLHDITARKRAEESLEHQAFHDGLTGLANRALFQDRVEHALELAGRTGVPPAVLYLDLDEFKRVNDTLGHEVGDRLLRQVASRLELVVRESDTVSRLGGDEFAILVEQGGGPEGELDHRSARGAEETAERVIDALRVPVQLGPQSLSVSVSIGIAAAGPGSDATTLLRDADTAMYHAKANGRGRFEQYSTEMREIALERLRIESDLPTALEQGQFRLVYQPIVQLDSLRVTGFEALLRWDHPVHGPIPPDRFIPICEENGMIHAIGEWVLRTACEAAAGWTSDGHQASISVNISGRQLSSDALVEQVRDVLDRTGIHPGSLVLEVTETSLVDDAEAAAERLQTLATLGVQLAIDDFGTGYSSLAYLRLFPVDILKIDGSFVQSINDPVSVPAIIPGLLGLGRTLGMQVVAEGIENDVQRTWLQAEGCMFGQGYLFSAPMSAEEATDALQHGALDASV